MKQDKFICSIIKIAMKTMTVFLFDKIMYANYYKIDL